MPEETKIPVPPATAARGKQADTPAPDPTDDMCDDEREKTKAGPLRPALEFLEQTVSKPYWKANADAISYQKHHRWVTLAALLTGTLAVLTAILELLTKQVHGLEEAEEWLRFVEPGLAVLALLSVSVGLYVAVQKKWLVERHKAERFRFLKYRSLIWLATRNEPGLDAWKNDVEEHVKDVEDVDDTEVKRWALEYRVPEPEDRRTDPTVLDNELDAIVNYYRRKRLEKQIHYFFGKSQKISAWDAVTKFVAPACFVLSVACAVAHFGIDYRIGLHNQKAPAAEVGASGNSAQQKQENLGADAAQTPSDTSSLETLSLVLIVFAAAFPVLGAAVRTLRSANEFSRNTARFNAMYEELREKERELTPDARSSEKIRTLSESERALEDEHREWLRLMDEAEWYG